MKASDVKVEIFKSSGPGGQHKNKKMTAVRLTHLATGVQAVAQKRRSLIANKRLAEEYLERKLEELFRVSPERKATKKTRTSSQRRLDWKRRHARLKQERRQRYGADD